MATAENSAKNFEAADAAAVGEDATYIGIWTALSRWDVLVGDDRSRRTARRWCSGNSTSLRRALL